LAASVLATGYTTSSFAQEGEESLDTLERSQARKKIVACADPYTFPYSIKNTNPPGFDVEIMEEIAKAGGMALEMYWADTGTRGGMSRALRNSIIKGRCDIFAGVGDNGDDDILMGQLAFSNPYMAIGYVLVVQNTAAGMNSIEELAAADIRIGVQMSTPMDDWLFTHGVKREVYPDNARAMKGMVDGQVDAALVWATVPVVAKKNHPEAVFKISEGFKPQEGQQWNLNYLVRKRDKAFKEFIDEAIQKLLDDGTIKGIVEKYGVPYFAPLDAE
ncbi:MAG: transporter substrate-binding domain-containing protein, partial [Betaproteobacteria bacterium]